MLIDFETKFVIKERESNQKYGFRATRPSYSAKRSSSGGLKVQKGSLAPW